MCGAFCSPPLTSFSRACKLGRLWGCRFPEEGVLVQCVAEVARSGSRAQVCTPAAVGPEPALWATRTNHGVSVSVLRTEHSAKAGARASGLMTNKTLERKTF